MAVLLTIIFLILFIISVCKDWNDEIGGFFAGGFVICLIVTAVFGGLVINGRTLDSKIAMYTEENQKIEEDMNILVEQYMNYESKYPELKADTLVEKQIEVYTANNKKIKELNKGKVN